MLYRSDFGFERLVVDLGLARQTRTLHHEAVKSGKLHIEHPASACVQCANSRAPVADSDVQPAEIARENVTTRVSATQSRAKYRNQNLGFVCFSIQQVKLEVKKC